MPGKILIVSVNMGVILIKSNMPKHQKDFLIWFGRRVRSIRQNMNLSQEDLAQIAGLDRTYMGGIERGERNIGLLNVKRLADALNITPKDLFDDDFQI